jgi:acetyl-CoA carboxylase, biotin carboxylase subunit
LKAGIFTRFSFMKFSRILVANRGEIALRIMRSAREMGIATVAVYSDADRNAPHVRFADQAVRIGSAASSDSYLAQDKIIEAALCTGAQAIHPGYGFLSENAAFVRNVEKRGLVFIGPSAAAMELMGSKLAAKQAAKQQQIPLVPGTEEALSDPDEAIEIARRIGYPLLIKASAGGGGKGMRIVHEPSQLAERMKMAMSEATSAFGDGSVFIERYIASPRHIEIQVLGDHHGNIVHLFERECSVQRRHQKIIEEAPSSVLTDDLRKQMGKCAVDVAKTCNYTGAGTVEFLFDEDNNFYFLEMNTRLQVEHPVTEFITGIDLVKEQIRVAMGMPLSFTQEEIKMRGHAVEVRVYAEDPANDFLPDIGKLRQYIRPQGPGIRVDDGYEEGMDIPIYYDPMIAKLIAFGNNREEALQRMTRAIDEYIITGPETTLQFCRFVINHPAFRSGDFDTHFVSKYYDEWIHAGNSETEAIAATAAGLIINSLKPSATVINKNDASSSSWRSRLQ